MPTRNNIQDIINEFNLKGTEYGLQVSEVVSYQNLKQSAIVMSIKNNEKILKSAQSWRVFFKQLENLNKTNVALACEKAQKSILKQNEDKAYFKVLEKAKERNHEISDFNYKNGTKNCTFTVFCKIHKKKFKKIRYINYMHPTIKFGIPCCSSTLRSTKQL